jgi:D-tyrosyl-tRNA(Tyr) deacylase
MAYPGWRYVELVQCRRHIFPDLGPFLAFEKIQVGDEFTQSLQGNLVPFFVIPFNNFLLVGGVVVHAHMADSVQGCLSMRVLLQRCSQARVRIDDIIVGEIGLGWLALVGVAENDQLSQALWLAEKVANLRAFNDHEGKMNRSVFETNGSILVVSNFTLYADCQKGRRPSFIDAARPEVAAPLVTAFADRLRQHGLTVAEGKFGADMKVELINDGPVTLMIESPNGTFPSQRTS